MIFREDVGGRERVTTDEERTGFELDRNAPERRSGSFFLNRNGVPVHFLENSERKSDSCCCVHTSVLPSVAVLKAVI